MFCSNFGFDIVDSVDNKEGLRMIDLDTYTVQVFVFFFYFIAIF